MRRRAPRASFVVTFALAATALASGCGDKATIFNNPPGPSNDGSAGCPAELPASGTPCDLPSSTSCTYGDCFGSPNQTAVCQQGTWNAEFGSCNPPAPIYEAGPDVYDAGPDVHDAAPDVLDGGPDGEGQDGGHD